MPESLEPILPHVPGFLLVMFRLTGIFVFGPIFSSTAIPMRVKALLALVLAVCIYPVIPPQPVTDLAVGTMAFAVASELTIGMVIGYGASLPLMAVQLGGLMIGQQLGVGLARVFSPAFDEEVDVLGQVFYLIALAVFVLLDGHHAMIAVLVRSFETVPLGGYVPDATVVMYVTGMLGAMFELAVRVAAPLLGLVFLETVAMGFIARTVPQLNVLSLGFPLRIVVGLFVMTALIVAEMDLFAEAILHALGQLARLFG